METLVLNAQKREIKGKKVKNMRKEGILPAVAYGNNFDSHQVSVNALEFDKAFAIAGYSQLIELKFENGDPWKVLVKEISYDVITGKPEHVDFLRVRMDEPVVARIPLELVGKSEGVTKWGGILMRGLSTIKVKALPEKLIPKYKVDITPLTKLRDSLSVRDIKLPEGVTVVNKPEEPIVSIAESRISKKAATTTEETAETTEEGGEGEEGKEPAK